MIRVVVVDDSALARKLVSSMLESDPEIEVVGTAMNGIFGLPCASLAQRKLARFPNMGAALIRASTAGCTRKILAAITPMKPPSIMALAIGKASSATRSRR